jgi:hypothetical protein
MFSVAFHEAAETLKKLKEELALIPPKDPKEYHHIDASLTNPALRPDAPWLANADSSAVRRAFRAWVAEDLPRGSVTKS